MPILVVADAKASGTSLDFTGVEAGDFMVAVAGSFLGAGIVGPSGWTQLFEHNESGVSVRGDYKVAVAGEDSTPSWSHNFGAVMGMAGVVYRQVDGIDDWDWAWTFGTVTTPPITATDWAVCLSFYTHHVSVGALDATEPSGYTLLDEQGVDHGVGGDHYAGVAVKHIGAGVEDPGQWTITGAGNVELTATIALATSAHELEAATAPYIE